MTAEAGATAFPMAPPSLPEICQLIKKRHSPLWGTARWRGGLLLGPASERFPYLPIAAPWGANFSTQGPLEAVPSSHKVETLGFGPGLREKAAWSSHCQALATREAIMILDSDFAP
jgi:hypothetical protein